MPVVEVFDMLAGGRMIMFECPGCGYNHGVTVDREEGWTWNFDIEKPTIRPSILAKTGHATGETICHSYVTDGRIEFLGDSNHPLSGQTVDLPQIEE